MRDAASVRPGLFRQAGLAVVALLPTLRPARAEVQLAASQKLGVAVVSDRADWCSARPALRVVGRDAQVFDAPEFAALIQRFAGLVLARQCPVAQELGLDGSVAGGTATVWAGAASAAGQWVPRRTALPASGAAEAGRAGTSLANTSVAAALPKGAAGSAAQEPPPATPALRPPVGSPAPGAPSALVGEWVGQLGCDPAHAVETTISVHDVSGTVAHAYVQVASQPSNAGAGALRHAADGTFDPASRQFLLRPGKVVRANGESLQQFAGALDPSGQALTLPSACYGTPRPQVLSRRDAVPRLSERVQADLARRQAWEAEVAAMPRPPGRLVGTMPTAEVRHPSCQELLAWAASLPLTLRVRLVDGDGRAMLRQYDDPSSAAVFGTPAYRWFALGEDGRRTLTLQPGTVVAQACTAPADQRDPRFPTLRQVVGDYDSLGVLGERWQTDLLVDRLPVRLATTGGTAAEMYADLAGLTAPGTLGATFQNWTRWQQQSLDELNRAQLASEAQRLRAVLARRGMAEGLAAIAAEPATEAGHTDVDKVAARLVAAFPGEAPAVRDAAATRKAAIAGDVAEAEAARLKAAPATLEGVTAARDRVGALKAALGGDLADGGAALDGALATLRSTAAPSILAAESAGLASTPASPDGARLLAERRALVLDALGSADDAQAAAYRQAADARLSAIGQTSGTALRAELDRLDPVWPSVTAARALAQKAAAPFGTSPAAQPLRVAGEARAQAIMAALSADAVSRIGAAPGGSVIAIQAVALLGQQEAAPFGGDPGGAAAAARIAEAARQRADSLATAYLPAYQQTLARAPASRAMAWRMAQAWVVLQRLSARTPGFARYAGATREAALRAQDEACAQGVARLGLSAADARLPMVLGDRVATLGTLACTLSEAGVQHAQLGAPEGTTQDRTLKLFHPAGRAGIDLSEGMLVPPVLGLAGAGGSATGFEPDPKLLFDFTAPPASPPPAGEEIEDVALMTLRLVDVGVDRKALVVVQAGDEAQQQPVSVAQWRRQSASIGAASGVTPETCATFAGDPSRLAPQEQARALIGCPRKA